MRVALEGGKVEVLEGSSLNKDTNEELFRRTGRVQMIAVSVAEATIVLA
jgi:hypothetical protein